MKFLILEYVFLTLIFLTLYYVGLTQKRKKGIIAVKDLRHLCKTDFEKKLYDGLIQKGIYVSPYVRQGYCSIPIALEQFKIAILFFPKRRSALFRRLLIKQKELYLRTSGWKVVKISDEMLRNNFDEALQVIIFHEKVKKI